MQTNMPIFEVYNHSVYMGEIAAVSYKQAAKRARAKWPNRRLQVEGPLNVRLSPRDRFDMNRSVQNFNAKVR